MAKSKIVGETPAPKPSAPTLAEPTFSGEGIYTGETVRLTPEQATARKRRSQWTALALFTFVILIFVITVAKLGPENLGAS